MPGPDKSTKSGVLTGIPLNQAAANRLGLPKVQIDLTRLSTQEKGRWIHTSFEAASPSTRMGGLALIRPSIAESDLAHVRQAVIRSNKVRDDVEITPDAGDFIVCYWNDKDRKHDKDCRRITRDQLKAGEY